LQAVVLSDFQIENTILRRAGERPMHDWSFSDTAEWVVGVLLAAAIVATMFV
jgi:hypothetical protein